MPFHTSYTDDGGVITTFTGVLTDNDLLDSSRRRYSRLHALKSWRYLVTDVSNVSGIELSIETIQQVTEMHETAARVNNGLCMVVITPVADRDRVTDMWGRFKVPQGWKTYVTDSRADAEDWLSANLAGPGNQ